MFRKEHWALYVWMCLVSLGAIAYGILTKHWYELAALSLILVFFTKPYRRFMKNTRQSRWPRFASMMTFLPILIIQNVIVCWSTKGLKWTLISSAAMAAYGVGAGLIMQFLFSRKFGRSTLAVYCTLWLTAAVATAGYVQGWVITLQNLAIGLPIGMITMFLVIRTYRPACKTISSREP